ncbi:MAG: DUF1963 domain-containing protein [Kamptonema sp. SIO4C4]|nr:DUF1963 domain-containing protein [Kamptonema sp. SIO4C4]
MPEFLQELPPRFEPLRAHLEAHLIPYIKFSMTRVGEPTQIDRTLDWCDDPLYLWQSKVGGHPYLPKGRSYPADSKTGQMMMFLMQINCEESRPVTAPTTASVSRVWTRCWAR